MSTPTLGTGQWEESGAVAAAVRTLWLAEDPATGHLVATDQPTGIGFRDDGSGVLVASADASLPLARFVDRAGLGLIY